MTQQKPLFEMRQVAKRFGQVSALEAINLALFPGEITALVGDNGAGKSTLIKLISGYQAPSSGEMRFEGKPIQRYSSNPTKQSQQLGIQSVYQHLGLVDCLSITRNFFLGFELKKPVGPFTFLDMKEMRRIVKVHLNEMNIKRDLDPDEHVGRLSGGERQVIAIARAKYFGAKLLILDEPTSALSLQQTQHVLDYIRLMAQQGLSVVVITHNLQQIHAIADRITVLYKGQLIGTYAIEAISLDACRELITTGQINRSDPSDELVVKTDSDQSSRFTLEYH